MSPKADAWVELDRYLEMTAASRSLWKAAQSYLPGGDTRSSIFWKPYPIYIERGEGSHVYDVDGTARLDFIGCMTTSVFGNAYPPVVQAIQKQAERGIAYNAPNRYQIMLAKFLCERVPSVDMVRFTNSGTEATLNAIRAARAFTGRTKLAKCEGGYHGTHDAVSVSVRTDPAKAGPDDRPSAVGSVEGLPPETLENVVVLPFNDTEASRRLLEESAGELAAVIVEPVLGSSGMVPAQWEYLRMLRDLTKWHGIVLIFDEVISFRVARGGVQELYDIIPDMTTFGKVIGGGFPVGAFGGSKEIMELFDPLHGPAVVHAGTFNGNPLTMLAGGITLEHLTPEVYERLEEMTNALREGIRDVCLELEVPVRVTGLGSLFGLHFVDKPVLTWRDVAKGDDERRNQVFWGLMNEGIMLAPSLVGAVSAAMTENEIEAFTEALRRVLSRG
ncbi:MAG: glutamate-1-semialdehyde 2,1-aminomutase [Dehalococcoidia bacterium]|nr:glutamate-1-semialdehyde 2,1-aminomutase [Dehalococcoidia bacterium]